MSNMFVNYVNNENYVPNNVCPPIFNTPVNCCNLCKPYEEVDINGNFVGYFWYYGNSIQLKFTTTGTIELDGTYETAEEYFNGKTAQVIIKDARYQEIYRENLPANPELIFNIYPDLAEKLLRGIYHISINIVGDDLNTIIIVDNLQINIK